MEMVGKMIALFGGDGRYARRDAVPARAYASGRSGGQGEVRALLDAIRYGTVRVVLVLVRWVGHAEYAAVRAACARAGVRCEEVVGGWSTARRRLRALTGRGA